MPRTPRQLSADDLTFLAERRVGTLTTIRADGTPHVVAIAFGYEDGVVRIITSADTQKTRNIETNPWAVVSQVDGRRWLSLEGPAAVRRDPEAIGRAVTAFERRYRTASENPRRVAIEITVERILGKG